MRLLVLLSVSALLPTFALAQGDWQLRREQQGVRVFTREVDNAKFDEIRVETVIHDVSLHTVVAVLRDTESNPEWVAHCEDAYVVERISPTEAVVYTRTNLPFPFNDRWVVSHSNWQQNPQTREVSMQARAIDRAMPDVEGGVRVTDSEVSWQLTPLPSGDIRIINQTLVNPRTAIPGWIAQSFMLGGPLTTMQNFREMVAKPQYQQAEVEFIQMPSE